MSSSKIQTSGLDLWAKTTQRITRQLLTAIARRETTTAFAATRYTWSVINRHSIKVCKQAFWCVFLVLPSDPLTQNQSCVFSVEKCSLCVWASSNWIELIQLGHFPKPSLRPPQSVEFFQFVWFLKDENEKVLMSIMKRRDGCAE